MLDWIQEKLTRFRYWLIRKLSLGNTIVLRAQVADGTLYLPEGRHYVANTVVTGGDTDFCEVET